MKTIEVEVVVRDKFVRRTKLYMSEDERLFPERFLRRVAEACGFGDDVCITDGTEYRTPGRD